MSVSVVCQNCHTETGGEEICPSCFAPTLKQRARYAVDSSFAVKVSESTNLGRKKTIPDMKRVSFSPSSWVSRTFTRMKGGLVSSAVALILVAGAFYFWNSHHVQAAKDAHSIAIEEFEAEEYEAAELAWEKSLASYRSIYDSEGQAAALYHISRAQMGQGNFDGAVESLDRAIKLDKHETYENAVLKYHRVAAVDALELSEEFIEEENFEQAEKQAELAVKRFQKGEGTEKQLTGAFRQSALCAALNHDFERADNLLDQAIKLTGESKQTAEVAADIALLYKESEAEKLALAKNKRYIPEGELDLSSITVAPRRRSRARSTRSASTYKPKKRNSRYTYNRRPRQKKTTLGNNGQAYPTGRKRYRSSNYNRYSSYNRYNSHRNYSSSRKTNATKPSYPTANKRYRPSSSYRPKYTRYPSTRVRSRPTTYRPVRSTGLSR